MRQVEVVGGVGQGTAPDSGVTSASASAGERWRPDPAATAAWLATIDELATEIAAVWPEGVTLEDVIRDMRPDE